VEEVEEVEKWKSTKGRLSQEMPALFF